MTVKNVLDRIMVIVLFLSVVFAIVAYVAQTSGVFWSDIVNVAPILAAPIVLGTTMPLAPRNSLAMNGFYKVLAKIYEVLSHPDRLRILNTLLSGSKSYSVLKNTINANPRMNSWHLSTLKEYGFIKKNGSTYEITDLGRLLANNSINEMVQIAEQTIQAYQAHQSKSKKI